jgi:glucose 1-dehydrogenase
MTESSAKLRGQVALVTGASGGIGRATALALAGQGADVALNYLTLPESAQDAARQIESMGREAMLCPVDVSDQSAVEGMVRDVVARLGRLDILVTSAVYSDREIFYEANMDGFHKTIEVSMWGTFYSLRAAAREMIAQGQGGNVVMIGSPHAHIPTPSCMAYNMAKAANDQMARTAALELAPHRVRVNIIHPGWTDTPGERKYFTEDTMQKASRQLPVGRLCQPEEIARGVMFLVDPESSYVTGSTLSIDGGSQLPWWSRRGTGEF